MASRHRPHPNRSGGASAGAAAARAADTRTAGASRLAAGAARLGGGAAIALIYVYQAVASVFPKACRFEPSCSHYGLEAIRVHGALAGGWLTVKRILRCRPGGGFGVDPVPPRGARARERAGNGCAHANRPDAHDDRDDRG